MGIASVADGRTAGAVARVPALPGAYALVLQAHRRRRVAVGSLGVLDVAPGFYIYCGSALGPGGLAARLGRHLRPLVSPHWHIDYLRPAAPVTAVLYAPGPARRECDWARLAAGLPGARAPLRGFGSSDCACVAHLVHTTAPPLPRLRQLLAAQAPGLCCIELQTEEDAP